MPTYAHQVCDRCKRELASCKHFRRIPGRGKSKTCKLCELEKRLADKKKG